VVPDGALQSLTGLLSVTTTGTGCWLPVAQFGMQSLSPSVPDPTASVPVHVLQLMLLRETVESPDREQPEGHAGLCRGVPLMSEPWAMKVSAPAGWTVSDGDRDEEAAAGVAAPVVAGAADVTVLVGAADGPGEDPQAVTSAAMQVSAAVAVARRILRRRLPRFWREFT